jgi:putative sugar O-methyltransferase
MSAGESISKHATSPMGFLDEQMSVAEMCRALERLPFNAQQQTKLLLDPGVREICSPHHALSVAILPSRFAMLGARSDSRRDERFPSYRTQMTNPTIEIEDDFPLLQAMLSDMESQSTLYQPGPYWARNCRAAAREIKTYGLADFRGMSNLIGQGFVDVVDVDWRNYLRRGTLTQQLFYRVFTDLFPFNKIYQNQVNKTKRYFDDALSLTQEVLRLKERTQYLTSRYKIPYSLLGGCIAKVKIHNEEIAPHYLERLSQHDYAAQFVDFKRLNSCIEIGGGFGVNMHLLLTNYENIRKVIYLDIPPNLYVGTQYLKAFFGPSVADYREVRERNSLAFASDARLEILCIAPWQIELLKNEVDVLINANSFVEMPKAVARNYADKTVGRFSAQKTAIVLTSYSTFDPTTTFHPDELPTFFETRGDFTKTRFESLIRPQLEYYLYVSPGRFAVIPT